MALYVYIRVYIRICMHVRTYLCIYLYIYVDARIYKGVWEAETHLGEEVSGVGTDRGAQHRPHLHTPEGL